jgi:two-component system, NtrC family, response regulator GlrR
MGRISQVEGMSGGGEQARLDGAAFEAMGPVGRRREDCIVGASDATRQVVAQATAAARTELPVVIVGQPGSDKELVARAIHAWGRRRTDGLELLSCAAVPEALQSRELFGCVENVYPAVPVRYSGALERAAGATLLLEEIEALRDDVRKALWGAVSERRFRREGEASPRPLAARLLASTSLAGALDLGELPHHVIRLRPLADRPEDVLPLAAHYLRAFADEAGVAPLGFTAEARQCLQAEPWPGDVRELRERVRQAVRLAGSGAVTAEALMLARDAVDVPSFKDAKRAFETRYVVSLLTRCQGNISRAARLAQKDRKDFYDVIRRTGIDPAQFRNGPV